MLSKLDLPSLEKNFMMKMIVMYHIANNVVKLNSNLIPSVAHETLRTVLTLPISIKSGDEFPW